MQGQDLGCFSCVSSERVQGRGLRCKRTGFGAARKCSMFEYEPGTDERELREQEQEHGDKIQPVA